MRDKPFFYIQHPELLYGVYEDVRRQEAIGVDTETTRRRDLPEDLEFNENIFKPGLDPYLSDVRLLQIATEERIYVIDCFHCPNVVLFKDIFESEDIVKIFHNAKFDIKMLKTNFGWNVRRIFCTMLASQLLSNGIKAHRRKHSLADVVLRYLNLELNKEEQASDWGREELTESQIFYAARDVDVLHDLCRSLLSYMKRPLEQIDLTPVARIEFNACIATAQMELNGVYVDPHIWNTVDAEIASQYHESARLLKEALGKEDINLDSPAQILKAFKEAGVDIPNTSAVTLKPMAKKSELIALLLEYRGLAKLLSSCGNGIPGKKRKKNQVFFIERIHPITGRIHPEFNQLWAETGRFSCERPNLQQIPAMNKAPFRTAFCGQTVDGVKNLIAVADYSQVEMRILAELSNDKMLRKAFSLGADLHSATAALMYDVDVKTILHKDPITGEKIKGPNYWMRAAAKTINFGHAA